MNPDYTWTPRRILLASAGVAVLSSLLTGGLVVWLLSGKKPPEPAVFGGPAPIAATTSGLPSDPLLAGNWHYDRQQWSEAISSYERALKIRPNDPDLRTDLGNCYRFSNRFDAALAEYETAQRLVPEHEHSLFNQVSLFAENLKNPAKADALAREFIRRFPESANVPAAKKYLAVP